MTRPSSRALWSLVVLGLALRLPGLLFNGMADDFEFVLDWGADVRAVGIGQGLSRNYGAVSFALFGVAAWFAEWMPRVWWLPLKAFEIVFELAALWALVTMAEPSRRTFVLVAYWLNPWFIWHGAYQGFWEGPHLFFGLLACLALGTWSRDDRAWGAAGAMLFLSWQSKPQGLVHFTLPVGLLLLCHFVKGRRAPLGWYVGGLAVAALLVSVVLWTTGGPALALWNNLRASNGDLRLSNGGPGLWRFVASAYMWTQGFWGEVYAYRLPLAFAAPLIGAALVVSVAVLALLFWRLAGAGPASEGPTFQQAWFACAAGALVMSQFAPLAHINHSYAAMVLLIPLLPGHRHLLTAWSVSVAILAYAHLWKYGLGSGLLPPDGVLTRYGHAGALADAVRESAAFRSPDALLRVQETVNHWLSQLPGTAFISALSLPVGIAAIVMTAALFSMARSGGPAGLRTMGTTTPYQVTQSE